MDRGPQLGYWKPGHQLEESLFIQVRHYGKWLGKAVGERSESHSRPRCTSGPEHQGLNQEFNIPIKYIYFPTTNAQTKIGLSREKSNKKCADNWRVGAFQDTLFNKWPNIRRFYKSRRFHENHRLHSQNGIPRTRWGRIDSSNAYESCTASIRMALW